MIIIYTYVVHIFAAIGFIFMAIGFTGFVMFLYDIWKDGFDNYDRNEI